MAGAHRHKNVLGEEDGGWGWFCRSQWGVCFSSLQEAPGGQGLSVLEPQYPVNVCEMNE